MLSLSALVSLALTVNEFSPWLYRGGFALTALITATLIASVVHPGGRLGRVLSARVLRWIGVRSYGIYLWHWPVFMVTRPQLDVALEGFGLLALRLAVTVALAELSYRLVETPVRKGAIERVAQRLRSAARARSRAALRPVSAAAAASSCSARSVARLQSPSPPGRSSPWATSVLLGSARALQAVLGPIGIDAAVGRQVPATIEALRAYREAGQLEPTVLVHVGNNGPVSARQFDELMQLLDSVARVVIVNVSLSRPWEAATNAVLAEGAQRHTNVRLVDWRAASAGQPALFYEDGVHPRLEGQRLYAQLVAAAVGE